MTDSQEESTAFLDLVGIANRVLQDHYGPLELSNEDFVPGTKVALIVSGYTGHYEAKFFTDESDIGEDPSIPLFVIVRATWQEAIEDALFKALTL